MARNSETKKKPAAGKKPAKKSARGRKPKKNADPAVEPEMIDSGETDADDEEIVEPDVVEDEDEDSGKEPPLLPEAVTTPVDDDKALISRTPLQRYLLEIRKIPLLSREEEYELAVRFREQGDLEAAYQLVTANLRLVVKIAMEFQRSFINVMDLIQEGNIGLMQAVQKFDPYKNVKLSSYSAWWIKAYILRHILNNWRMVKIGTTQAQRKLFYNLQKEKDRLEQMGFTPTPALLAKNLDVTAKEVEEMDQRLSRGELSTDTPVGEDGSATVVDLIPSGDTRPDEAVTRSENLAFVREALDEFARDLNDKDRYIFEKRMVAEDPLTLQQIGDRYGISRERVHQIESAIYKRLRAFLEERGIDEA